MKLLRLETITFSDATLSDINVVLCFVAVPGTHILRKLFANFLSNEAEILLVAVVLFGSNPAHPLHCLSQCFSSVGVAVTVCLCMLTRGGWGGGGWSSKVRSTAW